MNKRNFGRKCLIFSLVLLLIFSISMPSYSYAAIEENQDYLFITTDTTILTSETVNKTVVIAPNVTLTVSNDIEYAVNGNIIIYGALTNSGNLTVNGDIFANNYNDVFFGDQNNPAGKFSDTGDSNLGGLNVDTNLYPTPLLIFTAPENGSEVSTPNIKVEADSFPGLSYDVVGQVDNSTGTVGSSGILSGSVGLQEGENELTVTVTDPFGNMNIQTMNITYNDNGDYEAPVITSSLPSDRATEVSLDSKIAITYNEPITKGDQFSGIYVESNQEHIEIDISIEENELIILPKTELKYGSTYQVMIPASAIQDARGNRTSEQYIIQFTTEQRPGNTVSGGIYEDTTWTKDKSPYIVTGDIVVFPNATLTIEPGVTVKFILQTGLTLRGKMIAEGTEQEKITFTSEFQNGVNPWKGVYVDLSLGGAADLKYTEVSFANIGIQLEGGAGDDRKYTTLQAESSIFKNNNIGIQQNGYGINVIDNSQFIGNEYGVMGLFNKVSNSTFENNIYAAQLYGNTDVYNTEFRKNVYGIYGAYNSNIYKSTFTENGVALNLHSDNDIKYNDIQNNDTGLEIEGDIVLSHNEIINNNIGIDIKQKLYSYSIENNTIDNRIYNVKNSTKYETFVTNNYWGVTDELLIKEKIYDGYNDINYGVVRYKPYLLEKVSLVDTILPEWSENSYLDLQYINGSDSKRALHWNSASDNMGVKNYKIYMNGSLLGTIDSYLRTDSTGIYFYEVPTDLDPGTYTFKVEAGDFEGNWTTNGPTYTMTVHDDEAPIFPDSSEIRVVEKDATSVTLEWTPANDNVAVHEYNIIVDNSWSAATVPGHTTTYKLTGLWPGTEFNIKLEARDADGNTAIGPEVRVALEDENPPNWPDNARITTSNLEETAVQLTWPYALDEYMVEYEIYMNGQYVTKVWDNNYEVSGLTPGTEYTFTIYAIDGSGNKQNEGMNLLIKTPDYTAPTWAEGSTLNISSITEKSLSLSWPKANDNVSVTQYRVSQNGTIIKTVNASTTSYAVTGLSANTEYEFIVEAGDASGNWSTTGLNKSVQTLDDIEPYWTEGSTIRATSNSETTVDLLWPEANDNVYVSKYRVKQNGIVVETMSAPITNITINGLTGDTEYEFIVEAGDSSGNWSSPGLSITVLTKDQTAPTAPVVNKVTDQSTTVNGTAEKGTEVTVQISGESWNGTVNQEGKFSITITKQQAGTVIEVTAKDGAGNVSATTQVMVEDVTAPAAPVVNKVTDQSTVVTGTAETDSEVTVKIGNESWIGTSNQEGKFSITIPKQVAGTAIEVTAKDGAGNVSGATQAIVVDGTAPAAPVVNTITDLDTTLTGNAEPRSIIVAKVLGNEIGRSTLDSNGQFTITIEKQAAGSSIGIVAIDNAGNTSDPAYLQVIDEKPTLEKLVGKTRYSTAVEISKLGWETSETVYLVNGWAIADGLTATPLASANDAPILLTTKDAIPAETMDEIKRLKAKKVVLIGGTGVISANVENTLKSNGLTFSRIGGQNRYDTSLLIAKELDKLVDVQTVYMAYGFGEPDALSIAAQAGQTKQPIILTEKKVVPTKTYEWLKGEGLQTSYFIGGKSVIDPEIINEMNKITTQDVLNNRLSGINRQETNAKVIAAFYKQTEMPTIMVAHSQTEKLVDALAAGPLAAKFNVPVLLVSSNGLDQSQISAIETKQTNNVHQIGGGIGSSVLDQIVELMN